MKIAISIVLILLVSAIAAEAQYRNPYSGVEFNNQMAYMYSIVGSMNKRLGDATMRSLQQKEELRRAAGVSRSGSTSSSPSGPTRSSTPVSPSLPHYAIWVTDFQPPLPRVLPERLTSGPNIAAAQKAELRLVYNQLLDAFENEARKNNMANALAYAAAIGIWVTEGNQITQEETGSMIEKINNVLAANPQFTVMRPEQKQLVYESIVIISGIIALIYSQAVEAKDAALQAEAKEMGKGMLKHFLGTQ